jgi:hypothetical protein
MTVMPLYGFVQGDTMGVVVLARSDGTVADLAEKLIQAAGVRVSRRERFRVTSAERLLDLRATLRMQGIRALDRVDLAWD